MTPERKGLLNAILAHGIWGLIAVYWKLLDTIDPVELTAHRAVWSLGAFLLLVIAAGQVGALRAALRDARLVAMMAASGTLLAINWGVFVWATVNGHLLDASLGYFINPLVSVALGTIVLRERLSALKWIALALATIGVGIMSWRLGRLPWSALVLAVSFALYALVRKTARVDALVGSTMETLLLAPVGVIYLLVVWREGALGHTGQSTQLLLVGTGIVTAIPLVLFARAARRLPLSTMAFMQYLTPTGQFLLAVIAYGEPLAGDRLLAFAVIWVALAVFSVDLWRQSTQSVREHDH